MLFFRKEVKRMKINQEIDLDITAREIAKLVYYEWSGESIIEFLNTIGLYQDDLEDLLTAAKDNLDMLDNKGHKALDIIIKKSPIFYNWEHPSTSLFSFEINSTENIEKVHKYLDDFIVTHIKDQQKIIMIMSVILYRFNDKFISC